MRYRPVILRMAVTVLLLALTWGCAGTAPQAELTGPAPRRSIVPTDAAEHQEERELTAHERLAASTLPVVPPRDPGATTFAPPAPGSGAAGDPAGPAPGDAPGEGTSAQPTGVAEVQQRLTDLRYYAGPIDGVPGPTTRTAVQAFQKVHGLTVDGEIGPQTREALARPLGPPQVQSTGAIEPNRIEIDLDRQVMFVHLGGELARIMPISSGNGESYLLPGGVQAEALTPAGTFQIERRLPGVVNAHFGRLTDPMYFHEGWAIHGSGNVPPTPASHGCVRLPKPDAAWLFGQTDIGMQVLVYGERNAFHPALGETAGTDEPAGDTDPDPGDPPDAPPAAGYS